MIRVEHIAMYTGDLEATKDFFARYFDARAGELYHNEKTGFKSYFLSFPQGGARLELMNIPGLAADTTPGTRLGYAHLAISVGSEANVDSLTARLREDGYEVLSGPRRTGDGYYESCIAGPDGCLIEITV